ncbi:hypothetical protein AAFX24_28045 [Vibrio mediterranei]|uniref:hypothetical protein n=1 Tax=Vibrio mediterranei TaxID=689 RepID=UPI0038CEE830
MDVLNSLQTVDVDFLTSDVKKNQERSKGSESNRNASQGSAAAGSFDDYKAPLTGKHLLHFMENKSVKAGQMSAALEISSNRWANLVKVGADGRDMQYEHLPAPLEIFIRLCDKFPEHAPWYNHTPQEIKQLASWQESDLALACGTQESNVERWLKLKHGIQIPSQMQALLNLQYRLLDNGVDPQHLLYVADKVRTLRAGDPITAFSSKEPWHPISEQVFRAVRKVMRQAINSLEIDKNPNKPTAFSDKVMKEITQDANNVEKFLLQARVDGEAFSENSETLRLCADWLRARNTFHKLGVQWLDIKDSPKATEEDKEALSTQKHNAHKLMINAVAKLQKHTGVQIDKY